MRFILLLIIATVCVTCGYWIGYGDKELQQISASYVEIFPYCDEIPLDLYHTSVKVQYVPDLDANGKAFNGDYMIQIGKPQISTFAHESTHIADFIVERYGLIGYESRAYLVGYITGELYKCFHGNKS